MNCEFKPFRLKVRVKMGEMGSRSTILVRYIDKWNAYLYISNGEDEIELFRASDQIKSFLKNILNEELRYLKISILNLWLMRKRYESKVKHFRYTIKKTKRYHSFFNEWEAWIYATDGSKEIQLLYAKEKTKLSLNKQILSYIYYLLDSLEKISNESTREKIVFRNGTKVDMDAIEE